MTSSLTAIWTRTGRALLCLFVLAAPFPSRSAELQSDTIAAWNDYIHIASLQTENRLSGSQPFLWSDESPARHMRVQRGEVVVSPAHDHTPQHVPFGLIHDWIGAAFFPKMTLNDVFRAIRDYDRYKEFYKPLVIESKLVDRSGTDYQFSVLMLNTSLFSHTALAGSFEEKFVQASDTKWYSVAQSTCMQEVENYGDAAEHKLLPGEGGGYMWRLYGVSRFEERDGGVYVEVEIIALSRTIPYALRWVVEPIVRRVAKDSLLTSLQETRTAVQVTAEAHERALNETKMSASVREQPSGADALVHSR